MTQMVEATDMLSSQEEPLFASHLCSHDVQFDRSIALKKIVTKKLIYNKKWHQ